MHPHRSWRRPPLAARVWQTDVRRDIIGTMWWWKLDRRQKLRRVAVSLWTTPLILLFPLWLGALYEPSVILEFPSLFVLFLGIPFAAAAILYWLAARVRKGDSH